MDKMHGSHIVNINFIQFAPVCRYQTQTHINLSIFAKKVEAKSAVVEFKEREVRTTDDNNAGTTFGNSIKCNSGTLDHLCIRYQALMVMFATR